MISSLFALLFITSILAAAEITKDYCWETPVCGYTHVSQEIKFPFSLKDRHPLKHGCPGFVLSCNKCNGTMLELPNSLAKYFKVRCIDYDLRRIEIVPPPDFWARPKLGFDSFVNLSGSPFRLSNGLSRMTLLSCPRQSPNVINFGSICTYESNRSAHKTCVVPFDRKIEEFSNIDSCTKMYDFNAPVDLDPETTELTWPKWSCRRNVSQIVQRVLRIAGLILGSLIIILLFLIAIIRKFPTKKDRVNRLRIKNFLDDYAALNPSRYAYSDIKKITRKFKDKLGQGGYGTVFKGKLSSDILVAVKILNCTKEGSEEFINEVAIMGQIHHVNVVRLVGYCADGLRRALVYEFLPNGSLEKYISRAGSNYRKRSIGLEKFQDIAIGIAKGIEYLHQGCGQQILHFDIKPTNILLDRNFIPKISDFGLAKLCSKDQSLVSMSTARGTMGYIAPEVFSRNFGAVSQKSDVYSFGMLLLEIVGGRKNTEEEDREIYYPEWIYNLLQEGEDLLIQVEEEGDTKIAKKLAIVGFWCIQWHPTGRPTMKYVVQMLEGNEELTMPPYPFVSTGTSNTNTKIPARCTPMELEAIAE